MLQKFLTTSLAMAVIAVGYSQEIAVDSAKNSAMAAEKSPFKLSGSVDAYYRFNFNNPKTAPYNNLTSFTNSQNSFELGMATIKAEHTIGKVGFVADLGFGRRAEEFSYNDAPGKNGLISTALVKQAFITYSPSEHVKLTAGKWATHVGYELLDAYANRNYSMSYMFTNGPFFHTGVRADFVFEKTGFMIGIANPTDYTTTTSSTKTLIAQFSTGTKDDKLKGYLNYQGYFGQKSTNPSASSLNQLDLVLLGTISPKFSLGYNGTIQYVKDEATKKTKKWMGSALYINYDPTSWFGLTWRNEYFNDEKYGLKIYNGGSNVIESTLSANFKVDNFKFIPEFRLDNSSQQGIFYKSDGTSTKRTLGFLMAMVYSF